MAKMPVVQGTPGFPFYMPGSSPVEYPDEEILRQRALALHGRGYQAGIDIDPGDPYIGKVLGLGDLYYQSPQVPGYHFQQRYVEGEARPPVMLPGGLDERIALELALRDAIDTEDISPAQRAYANILSEVDRRARVEGRPLQRRR